MGTLVSCCWRTSTPTPPPGWSRTATRWRRRRRRCTEDELIAAIGDVQVLGIRSGTHVTERVLAAAPDLLAVGAFCIGVNQIDLAAASRRGIAVFNAPFSNTRSVVELAAGRDHRADPAADRQERADARGHLGQVGGGQPRGARAAAGHRRLRQHRRPALGAGREPRHDRVLLRHRGQAGPGQRAALRHAGRAAGDLGRGHAARGRPAGQQRAVRRGRVRGHEAGQPVPEPVPRLRGRPRGAAPAHRVRAPGRGGRGRVPAGAAQPRRGVPAPTCAACPT